MFKFSLLLGIFLGVFTTVVANAYTFTSDFQAGAFWPSLPVDIDKFAVDASEGTQLSAVVSDSEDEWESAVGTELWDFSTPVQYNQNFSGNNIRWSNNFSSDTGYDSQTTLAVTIRYRQGNHLVKTEIILNGELAYLRQNQGNILKKTILHELGHVIGLDHTSHYAIMRASVTDLDTLQSDDINGAIAVTDETLARQAGGGNVQPLAGDSIEINSQREGLGACGTVAMIDDQSGGGPGNGFIASLLIGMILTVSMVRLDKVA